MKKVLVPLAPGFEEIEAVTVVDILRRAGAVVTLAGTVAGTVEGRSGIRVIPDTVIENVEELDFDMVVLPGGAVGTENLKKDRRVKNILERLHNRGRFIAAICAAPAVLSAIGITRGRTVTSHPSVRGELKEEVVTDDRVVVDGNIITGLGAGSAMEFAFKLVETLFGKEKVKEVNSGVLAKL
ncbi:MAG: DJ-1/PfpI family protein [Deltaproteobacteria bacterium]|nr:DJ-1/PfpI family protein [Deltaproteobacteria bacterium]